MENAEKSTMLGGKWHLKGRKQSNDVSASRKTWLPADVGDVDAFPSLFFVFSFFVSWSQQSLETIKKTGSKKKGRGESHSIQAISKEVRKVRRFGAQMKFLRMAIMTRCVFFFLFFCSIVGPTSSRKWRGVRAPLPRPRKSDTDQSWRALRHRHVPGCAAVLRLCSVNLSPRPRGWFAPLWDPLRRRWFGPALTLLGLQRAGHKTPRQF